MLDFTDMDFRVKLMSSIGVWLFVYVHDRESLLSTAII